VAQKSKPLSVIIIKSY